MSEIATGGCLCGAVRYRVAGPFDGPSICHCRSCRRAAGAPSVAWLTAATEGFAWTRGAPARHASSPGIERTHCAACGTSLTWQGEPGRVDVTLASLDDPEAVPPVAEIWLSHRLSWEPVDPDRPGYAEGTG